LGQFYLTSIRLIYQHNYLKIEVRKMKVDDSNAVNLLSQQLGYSLSIPQTIQNIKAVINSKGHTAFVAVI